MITDLEAKKAFKMTHQYSNFLIFEDEYWNYLIDLYEKDYGFKTKWEQFKKDFYLEFNNDFSLFEKEYDYVKKELSEKIDLLDDNPILPQYPDTIRELFRLSHRFKNENSYISIDITKAYSAAIDKLGVLDKSWKDTINELTTSEILKNSKKLRVLSYPKNLNTNYLKRLCYQMLADLYNSNSSIIQKIKKENLEFCHYITDELVWNITGKEEIFNKYDGKKFVYNDIEFHITVFKYKKIFYKFLDEKHFDNYRSYLDGHNKLMINFGDNLFANQLLKISNGQNLNEKDLFVPNGLYKEVLVDYIHPITEEEYNKK